MEQKEIVERRKQLEKDMEQLYQKGIKQIPINDIEENIGYFENISLGIKTSICDILEDRLFEKISNKKTVEILKDILLDSDIFMRYEFMDNNLYLHIIKQLVEEFKDIDLEKEIEEYLGEYYEDMTEEEIEEDQENSDYSPQIEIQLDLNFENESKARYPINKYDLIYADPITLYGYRFTDEGINPYSSIMLYGFI